MITNPPATRRSRRDERGSVLIFVVGVLVLLALAATAYLSTVRVDRVTTKQNEFTTQIDLLLEGCRQAVIAKLTRTDNSLQNTIGAYDPADSYFGDTYLAARVPVTLTAQSAFDASTNPGTWRAISSPIIGTQFETPSGQFIPGTSRLNLIPDSATFNGRLQQAFAYVSGPNIIRGTDLTAMGANMFFAADADGDGIADSIPEKLPVGKINGIEYFVSYRIIDNNSAININTAISRDFDFTDPAGTPANAQTLPDGSPLHNWGFFTGNVGLAEMLFSTLATPTQQTPLDKGREFRRSLEYRTGGAVPVGIISSSVTPTYPLDDTTPTPGLRTDFVFLSWGDAFNSQLAFRLNNPGYSASGTRFQAYTVSDSAALAARFTLTDSLGDYSQAEQDMSYSLLWNPLSLPGRPASDGTPPAIPSAAQALRSAPYAANEAQSVWFPRLFDYISSSPYENSNATYVSANFKPLRALLTASAETRNMIPTEYAAGNGTTAGHTLMPAFANGANARTSVNTASFGELFRAFWQVMATDAFTGTNDNRGTIFDAAIAGDSTPFDPYKGMKFAGNTSTPDTTQPQNMARMFRSPIRGVTDAPATYPNGSYANAPRMAADQVLLLRAALAAVNTEAMRRQNITNGNPASTGNTPPVVVPRDVPLTLADGSDAFVRVFGHQPQPYITEVFAHNDTQTDGPLGGAPVGKNINGYIAIELYNPHDFAIDISNCKIATLHRNRDSATPADFSNEEFALRDMSLGATPIDLSTATSNLDDPTAFSPMVIPAKGYLVLENYDTSGTPDPQAAVYRPGSSSYIPPPPSTTNFWPETGSITTIRGGSDPKPANVMFVKNLHLVMNREFILMRPFNAVWAPRDVFVNTAPAPTTTLVYTRQATADILTDFMPLDSYDLTSLSPYGSLEENNSLFYANATAWTYQRSTTGWRFVYPGRYDAIHTATPPASRGFPRQSGTLQATPWIPGPPSSPNTTQDPWDPAVDAAAPRHATLGGPNDSTVRLEPLFDIQLANAGTPGPNPLQPGQYNAYPFGRFARDGDILQVPFIGSYIIRRATPRAADAVLEVNPITMDAAMAEDTDTKTDPAATDDAFASREQIGRFVPLRAMVETSPTAWNWSVDSNIGTYSDYSNNTNLWRYAFGRKLFDFLTVRTPADDYMPNIRRDEYGYFNNAGTGVSLPAPQPVSNSGATAADRSTDVNDDSENAEPISGRININTAPYKVLSMIPWVPKADNFSFDPQATALSGPTAGGFIVDGSNGRDDNEDIARALVYWRDGDPNGVVGRHGPFNSISDVYKIPGIIYIQSRLLGLGEPNDAGGDLTPIGAETDLVRNDFEEQSLILTRVSNLITTRSDTYTVYILLQGWRNAGSAAAELVVERRAAMIVDRSRYTETNGNVTATRVPTN